MSEPIPVQPNEVVKFDFPMLEKLAGRIRELTELENCPCACHMTCKHCVES